jgi:hypothetical protein
VEGHRPKALHHLRWSPSPSPRRQGGQDRADPALAVRAPLLSHAPLVAATGGRQDAQLAIIGSGPAGYYSAEALQKQLATRSAST